MMLLVTGVGVVLDSDFMGSIPYLDSGGGILLDC